jgi:hypothetical protein
MNNIIIWDSQTLEIKARVCDYFKNGVLKIKLSHKFEYFMAIGKSDSQDVEIIIFDVAKVLNLENTGRRDDKYLTMTRHSIGNVLGVCFDANDTQGLISTLNNVYYLKFYDGEAEFKEFKWKK